MGSHWHDYHWAGVDAAAGTLTAPTLTWTDAADGSGGTVTIADTDANATNTVYTQAFSGLLGTSTWISGGSRTGDGDKVMMLEAGHYQMYVRSVLGAESTVSTIHYVTATDGTESNEYQCLLAIQSRLRALSLSGFDSSSIVVREIPSDRNLTFPTVVIAPQRNLHPLSAGSNFRDDVTYGIYVAIFAADNQTLSANIVTYTKWINQIARAFRGQRLSAVDASVICAVEPVATVPWGEWTNNIFAGGMLVKCVCRETRGLT